MGYLNGNLTCFTPSLTLEQVTETKEAENYRNLFENGIDTLESETATFLRAYAFCDVARNKLDINLPKVTAIEAYALQANTSINNVYIPMLETIGSTVFFRCTFIKSLYFPKLKDIGINAFQNAKRYTAYQSVLYLPALESIASGALSGASQLRVILKTIPTLAAVPSWTTRQVQILIPSGTLAEYQAATNWADVPLVEATTFETDASKWWNDLIENEIITEEEARAYYA